MAPLNPRVYCCRLFGRTNSVRFSTSSTLFTVPVEDTIVGGVSGCPTKSELGAEVEGDEVAGEGAGAGAGVGVVGVPDPPPPPAAESVHLGDMATGMSAKVGPVPRPIQASIVELSVGAVITNVDVADPKFANLRPEHVLPEICNLAFATSSM